MDSSPYTGKCPASSRGRNPVGSKINIENEASGGHMPSADDAAYIAGQLSATNWLVMNLKKYLTYLCIGYMINHQEENNGKDVNTMTKYKKIQGIITIFLAVFMCSSIFISSVKAASYQPDYIPYNYAYVLDSCEEIVDDYLGTYYSNEVYIEIMYKEYYDTFISRTFYAHYSNTDIFILDYSYTCY
jgi:hypothetical protein